MYYSCSYSSSNSQIQENLISTANVKKGEQLVDLLTKAMSETRVNYLCSKLA